MIEKRREVGGGWHEIAFTCQQTAQLPKQGPGKAQASMLIAVLKLKVMIL